MIQFFTLFCLACEFTQTTDVTADARGVEVENEAQQNGEHEGKEQIGVVGLKRLGEFYRIGYCRTDDQTAEVGGRIEVSGMRGGRQTFDGKTVATM